MLLVLLIFIYHKILWFSIQFWRLLFIRKRCWFLTTLLLSDNEMKCYMHLMLQKTTAPHTILSSPLLWLKNSSKETLPTKIFTPLVLDEETPTMESWVWLRTLNQLINEKKRIIYRLNGGIYSRVRSPNYMYKLCT